MVCEKCGKLAILNTNNKNPRYKKWPTELDQENYSDDHEELSHKVVALLMESNHFSDNIPLSMLLFMFKKAIITIFT